MSRLGRAACIGLLALGGCDATTPPGPPTEPGIDQQLRQQLQQWGVVAIGPMTAQSPALVDLGQALFFDKILSGNRDIACATCHDPLSHGTDGLSLAIGTGGSGLGPTRTLGPGRQFVPRNAPSMLNQGLRPFYLFWDGRISGFGAGPFDGPRDVVLPPVPNILAAQGLLPVLNRREMRGDSGDLDVLGNPNELALLRDSQYVEVWRAIMQRLLAIPDYGVKFGAAYPGTPASALGFQHATTAIAAFLMERLTRYDSPFDRYLHRDDAALTAEAKRGALLFFGRLPCAQCHNGPLLGAERFANVGVPQLGPGVGKGAPLDLGRAEVLAQELVPSPSPSFYRFAFRPPPLRNVELTAPYMHDGAYPTLEVVVRHYNDVRTALRTYDPSHLDAALRAMYHGDQATINDVLSTLEWQLRTPLNLSDADRSDLVAFLKSLTDPAARDLSGLIPSSVPSGLPVRE